MISPNEALLKTNTLVEEVVEELDKLISDYLAKRFCQEKDCNIPRSIIEGESKILDLLESSSQVSTIIKQKLSDRARAVGWHEIIWPLTSDTLCTMKSKPDPTLEKKGKGR